MQFRFNFTASQRVVLCVQRVEEQTVNDLPLLVCRSHLQQRRGAEIHTARFISWKTENKGTERMSKKNNWRNYLNVTDVVSGSFTFSFLEEFLVFWTFWLQWIYKSCSENKREEDEVWTESNTEEGLCGFTSKLIFIETFWKAATECPTFCFLDLGPP